MQIQPGNLPKNHRGERRWPYSNICPQGKFPKLANVHVARSPSDTAPLLVISMDRDTGSAPRNGGEQEQV